MKYCLSARQPDSLLKKIDEIKIELRDFRAIPDYIEKFPDKTLILELENTLPEDFNWEVIAAYSQKMEDKFFCAISNVDQIIDCREHSIKYYYKYPINSMFELDTFARYEVSYILIGTSLIFNLKNVASYKIPLRFIPNLAYEPYLRRKDGIVGGWVRPEDMDKYGQYLAVAEFYAPGSLDKESALFHVYAENKTWPGNLNLLIEGLGVDFDNRILYDADNFAIRRMGCKQKCLDGKTCHYCEDQIQFVPKVLKKYSDYKNYMQEKKD